MFAHYSGLALKQVYGSLIDVTASSEFAVCTLMIFMHVADSGFTGTSQSDSRLQPRVLYLVTRSSSATKLVDAIRVCSIVNGYRLRHGYLAHSMVCYEVCGLKCRVLRLDLSIVSICYADLYSLCLLGRRICSRGAVRKKCCRTSATAAGGFLLKAHAFMVLGETSG